ncbi:MAG: hypothetical protein ABR498_07025, partial [Candidatus Dormibacteria bacterium]
ATTSNPACGAVGQPTCWELWWGTSDDYGQTWTEGQITNTVHTGILCVEGGGCGAAAGDRNLLDDFGVAIDPKFGSTAITFDNDQPESAQGKTHTDYAYALTASQSQAGVPEMAWPWLAVAVGAIAGGAAWRRKRAVVR